ncbi:hypothetical protein B0H10DRAFT_1957859 [Mycena sp. CBHHK59/15]|nr:hypothetical protein B0H10DRAFT_1957859 [Mycena sp. CBHHK59/15]
MHEASGGQLKKRLRRSDAGKMHASYCDADSDEDDRKEGENEGDNGIPRGPKTTRTAIHLRYLHEMNSRQVGHGVCLQLADGQTGQAGAGVRQTDWAGGGRGEAGCVATVKHGWWWGCGRGRGVGAVAAVSRSPISDSFDQRVQGNRGTLDIWDGLYRRVHTPYGICQT